jgi:AraC-like DNA-binding protein
MFRMQRALRLGTTAHRGYSLASLRGVRAYVCDSSHSVVDSTITASLRVPVRSTCCNVAIPLEGRYSLWRNEGWEELGPGELVRECPQGAERWEGHRFSVLVLEWDAGEHLSERSRGTLSVGSLSRLRGIADLIREGRATRSIFDELAQTVDLPSDLVGWIRERDPIDPSLQPAADALGMAMSRAHDRPAWVDLEGPLARSERHSRRLLTALFDVLGIHASMREYLRTRRLSHAAQLLTAPGASVDEVARAVGYGSSRALGTALEQAGLPRARELRAAILRGR